MNRAGRISNIFTKRFWVEKPSTSSRTTNNTRTTKTKKKKSGPLFKGLSLGKKRHAVASVITIGLMATILTEIVSAFTSIVNGRSLAKHADSQGDYVQKARALQAQSSEFQRLISWSGDLALGLLSMFILGPWAAALATIIAYRTTKSLLPERQKIAVLRSGNEPQHQQAEQPDNHPQPPPQPKKAPPATPPPQPAGPPMAEPGGLTAAKPPTEGDAGTPQAKQPINIYVNAQGGQGGQSTVSDIANDVTGAK